VSKYINLHMELPKGMKITRDMLLDSNLKRNDDIVLQLLKSLYGLKQAGRLWGIYLSGKLDKIGFIRCVTDMCLYYKRVGEDIILIGRLTDRQYVERIDGGIVWRLDGPQSEEFRMCRQNLGDELYQDQVRRI
jgi:hypothetical protein